MQKMKKCEELGILKVDMNDVKNKINLWPKNVFKNFEKFLPNLVNTWCEDIIEELKSKLKDLQRECTNAQEFVEFFDY